MTTLGCEHVCLGGLGASPRKCLKIRPSKGESESIFSYFSVENNEISVYQNTYFFIKSRLIAICSHHACMTIFLFVATKHLDIAYHNASAPLQQPQLSLLLIKMMLLDPTGRLETGV